MPQISDSDIANLISNANLVEIIGEYIKITKKGRSFWAICPFHDDSKPSLSISEQKKIFKCFSCGQGGNIIYFVMKYENISFVESVKKIASKTGISINVNDSYKKKYSTYEEKIIEVLHQVNIFFQYQLASLANKDVKTYCKERKINNKLIEDFNIGWCPSNEEVLKFLNEKFADDSLLLSSGLFTRNMKIFFENRITFAIKNNYGNVVGFSGRVIDDSEPKYKNSPDSSLFKKNQLLYNYSNASNFIRKSKQIVITEGFFDVFALSKINIKNVIAVMGTALTNYHGSLLKNLEIILFYDSDQAGIKATIKSIQILQHFTKNIEIVVNKTKLDPDEVLSKYGQSKLEEVFNDRISALEFIYKLLLTKKEKNNISDEKFLDLFKKYIDYASNFNSSLFVSKLSHDLKIDKEVIIKHLQIGKKQNHNFDPIDNFEPHPIYEKELQPVYEEINIKSPTKNDQKKTTIQRQIGTLKQKINMYQYTFIKSILENKYLHKYLSYDLAYSSIEFGKITYVIEKLTTNPDALKNASPEVNEYINIAKKEGQKIVQEKDFLLFLKEFQKKLYNLEEKFIQKDLYSDSLSNKEKNKLLENYRMIKINQKEKS